MAEALSTLQLATLAQQADKQRRLLAAEPLAVVGIGCRFPAGPQQPDLSSPEAYWQFLEAGGCAIGDVPRERWSRRAQAADPAGGDGLIRGSRGAFLHQIDGFEPGFFGISPREARAIDPQHRLLLEVAQEALERAGYGAGQLAGSRTGVFMGLCTTDYAWRQLRGGCPDSNFDLYFATGNSFSVAVGRIAHVLGLEGPALAVDTACSSSLVAVDLACRSLRDRSSDVALAGGVSLLLSPVNSLCFTRSGMMARDGRCKSFDASADGYGRGEGCGVVVIKRLADALAAGDPIWAVLRGSGVNQDGASAGLTVPNSAAQRDLLQRTLERACLRPEQVQVLEAHGTGTPLGDPIELQAAAQVYGQRSRPDSLRVSTAKANLGHLEAAAGIAGLIKAVLMVQHGRIPPHPHLIQPTPQFNWDAWALQLVAAGEAWPASDEPRRVAVSSFGFSGTNAHVLVEQAPAQTPTWARASGPQWLLLAARSGEALAELVARHLRWLPEQPAESWPAICLAARRALRPWPWRVAVQASSLAEACRVLASVEPQPCQPEPGLLAMELTPDSTASQLEAWAAYGVRPTALIHRPEQETLARDLAGSPARLRLLAQEQAAELLPQLGYPAPLQLSQPCSQQLVELWLAGHTIRWERLEPPGPWHRPVLPTTPFQRQRCWIDGSDALAADDVAENDVAEDGLAGATPGRPGLEHQPVWQPVSASSAAESTMPPTCIRMSSVPDGAALEALEQALADAEATAQGPVEVMLTAPLVEPATATLDLAFWQRWLPLLQRLAALRCRVHWGLGQPGTPMGEALAALARGWAREVGDQAGGLLWVEADTPSQALAQLEAMRQACPRGGVEWRWHNGQIQQVHWVLQPQPPESTTASWGAGSADGTVLITGGLGALGLATAAWLGARGFRHLTLLSRRPPGPEQQHALDALMQQGVAVELVQRDLSDPAQVSGLLSALRQPLLGIIHAAGVLDDGLLPLQTPERCAAVAAAKATGGLLLEQLSRRQPGAFFIAYSSVAAVLGSPGQLAYGAANGYLDGLLLQRRRQGLAGLAVNWGPWDGPGMASHSHQLLPRLAPDEALAALEAVLARGEGAPGRVVLARLEPDPPAHPALPRLRALAAQLETSASDDEAAAAIELCLVELLADLVGCEPRELGSTTRLDALGLDSLMAVELASAVQAGLDVNLGLGALAGDPTVGSLAAHLLQLLRDPSSIETAGVDLGEEARLPTDLAQRLGQLAADHSPAPAQPDEILLTGATGFLGAFLLADQLQRHPQLRVHCLVRADDPAAASLRVRANLEHYGLWQPAFAERIVGLPGDLAQPQLGLEAHQWQVLAQQVQGVLHNGAQLSYVAPYGQLRAANVGGTVEVLRLASERGLPLEFVSSTAVYEAAAYRGQELDEQADLSEWQGIHLGYSQTKWVSERLVWRAAKAGLPVRLYRPPLIAGHSRSGAWHQDDFLHRLIRGCLALGLAPSLEMALDLVPVDYVVAAIGALAWQPVAPAGHPAVLHLHHPEPVLWADLLQGLLECGAPLQPIALEAWLDALAQQPGNPLYPLQPFFRQRWGAEQLTYAELNQPGHKALPRCEHTLAVLAAHGVTCPHLEELIGPYALAFMSRG